VEFAEAITAGHRNNAIYTMAPWTAVEDAYFREYVGDGHTRRTVLKLAALLHDIAKPQTRGPDAKGRIRFLGHSEQGAEVSEVRLAALRMSGQIQSLVSKMVLYHLRPSQLRHGEQMPSSRAIYRYYRDLGPAAVDTLYLAMADFLAARGPELSPERWANYARMVAAVLEAGAGPPIREDGARALVNGNDLMNSLNIPPGPLVGRLLENLREAEATGEVATRDDALALAARLLRNGEGR
jgi:poly(A) polymerase